MKIIGTEGMTAAQVHAEVSRGGKFVIYQYCVSVVFMSFRRGSDIYFIPAGGSNKGAKYSLLSLLLGWWGIPWGPIFTFQCLWNNSRGGKDVTAQIVKSPGAAQAIPQAQRA